MLKFFRQIVMAPAEEISGGNAPESKANPQGLYDKGDPNETFDDLEYESPASKAAGDHYKETFKDKIKKAKENSKAKESAKEKEEEDSEEEDEDEEEEKPKKKKSDMDTLSDKVDGEEEEEKPKKKAKEDKKEEVEEEDEEESSEEEEEEKALDKEKKGKIKVRMNGELYGLDGESMVRYKVDGEYVEKPLQEVLNKASGVEALDKRFSEYDLKMKEFKTKEAQLAKKTEVLSKVVEEVVGIVKDPNANPMDAVLSLVEKSGGDVYNAERRLIEACLDTIEKLQGMSEAEVKAYWLERKDAIRSKADETRQKAFEKEQTLKKSIQELDAYRQTLGVSEEQFNEAWDELESQGLIEKFTDKQIAEYASNKPFLNEVQDILEPFEDKIQDSEYEEIVRDFAKQLKSKKLTSEQLKKIVKAEFADEDLKDLATRSKAASSKKAPEKKTKETKHEYESFDDFE
jgi:hypothetical protein